jgi:FkbM family methyltransferase
MAWWDSHRGGAGATVMEIQPGVQMRLYFDSNLCRLIFNGGFETSEIQFLNAFLKPGDTFADIGANVGLFTLIAGRLVGGTGVVHAFEPCAKTHDRLLENVRLNNLTNVTCHRLALSDNDGEADMVTDAGGFDAWNSMATPYMGTNLQTEMVRCAKWDTYAKQIGVVAGDVAMMKIDVEGWEKHILLGAHQTLSRDDAPLLQVEFTEQAAKAANSSCRLLHQTILDLGYQLYSFDVSLSAAPIPLKEVYGPSNLFAIKHIDKVRQRVG